VSRRNDTADLLHHGLRQVEKQAEHLRYTLAHLAEDAPLDDPVVLEAYEALTARFARLQDLLLRPFRAIAFLELEEEKTERIPDLLNLMEKRGIVTATADWPVMRKLRNAIAHEYWDTEAELRSLLHGVRSYSLRLLETTDRLLSYAKRMGY